MLRLSWDNGDRTVLVNPELGGVTLGWNLVHTAQDELFAAIEGTAFHTRIILERMAEHGVRIDRVINAGGIPQKNEVLNRIYANVLEQAGAGARREFQPAWVRGSSRCSLPALTRRSKRRRPQFACRCARLSLMQSLSRSTNSFTRSIAMCTLRWERATLRRLRWATCCRS